MRPDFRDLPEGNYVVRGRWEALVEVFSELGELVPVERVEDWERLTSPFLGRRYYVWIGEPKPVGAPPRDCWRLCWGPERAPRGWEVVDLRDLGGLGKPPVRFRSDRDYYQLARELIEGIRSGDVGVWLRAPKSALHALFERAPEGAIFRLVVGEAFWVHWDLLRRRCPLSLESQVLLFGVWLWWCQRLRGEVFRPARRVYFYNPPLVGVDWLLDLQEVDYDVIAGRVVEA